MKTAILIDGAFFIKRYRLLKGHIDGSSMAAAIHEHALKDLELLNKQSEKRKEAKRECYRILFYDCPPLEKKLHNPVTGKSLDLAKSKEALFRNELHAALRKKRKVALRLGKIADYGAWQLKPEKLKKLLKGELSVGALTEDDVDYDMKQKGVDMRLGLDISALAHNRSVDQIILIAGDSDFVPAAKVARRLGIDFVLDPLRSNISADLQEHIDGIISAL